MPLCLSWMKTAWCHKITTYNTILTWHESSKPPPLENYTFVLKLLVFYIFVPFEMVKIKRDINQQYFERADLHFVKSASLSRSCQSRQRDTTSSLWKFKLNNFAVKELIAIDLGQIWFFSTPNLNFLPVSMHVIPQLKKRLQINYNEAVGCERLTLVLLISIIDISPKSELFD